MFHPEKCSLRAVILSTLCIVLALALMTCNSGDEEIVEKPNTEELGTCLPVQISVYKGVDSVAILYNDTNRLTEMQFFGTGSNIRARCVMTYADDKLATFTKLYPTKEGVEVVFQTYTFAYNTHGKPSTVTVDYGDGNSAEIITYAYDERDRLINREFKSHGNLTLNVRYEYSGNNVSKTFLTRGRGATEILSEELLSFDSHSRFFSGSADLTLVLIYILNWDPSLNNLRAEKIYATVNDNYAPPLDVHYDMTYDDHGYVQSLTDNDSYHDYTLNFRQVVYKCE
jgi:hypothetical protein